MRSPLSGIGGIVALTLAFAIPSEPCCSRGWKICGTAGSPGQVEAKFTVVTGPGSCTAMGPVAVVAGDTAAQVCTKLKLALDGDCDCKDVLTRCFYGGPPMPVPCSSLTPLPCTFTCGQLDPNCWLLIDATNCWTCDVVTGPTTCCGLTIDAYTP